MYHCYLFRDLIPAFLREKGEAEHGTFFGEGETPERAMRAAETSYSDVPESYVSWQPCSGRVFCEGMCVGVVFSK